METTRKTARKTGSKASEEKIRSAYQEYLLTHGKRPVSIYKFCLDLGIKEEDFYLHFGSFDGLEKNIWNHFIEKTLNRLKGDTAYPGFSAREKVLAFYYTLFEELKSNRSYILLQLASVNRLELIPEYIKTFRSTFKEYIGSTLQEGKGNGEIAERPYLDSRYPELFWLNFGFVLLFWKNDDSPGFEKTDAAIEKSINLAFDLISRGAVDSMIDFGKFLYQNKVR